MAANLLATRVKETKRELLALKTACAHGLGSASFYSATGYYEMTVLPPYYESILSIAVVVPAGLSFSPYCQCYISNAQNFQPTNILYDESTNRVTFSYRAYFRNATIPVNVKVICTVPIESLVISGGTQNAK
jgi:hypothetical protein